MSDDRRNETQLLCDVLGLESLVDETSSKLLSTGATPSAILGPFYRAGAPSLPNGASIVRSLNPLIPWYDRAISDSTFIHGQVYSTSPKGMVPLAGATVDVWHTAPNGLYEQQDTDQPEMNLRGRFTTDEKGQFCFYALRPVAYPVPDDGPAGRLLGLLDRHPYRPAHIHFIVEAPGHRSLTTQLFDAEDKYIQNDSVFAVKKELMVKFKKREGDPKANWELGYDFTLSPDG
jgi:catechol 1,2-dioxygenase